MRARTLGKTGITVSEVGFGAWAIGGPAELGGVPVGWGAADDRESLRALEAAFERGSPFTIRPTSSASVIRQILDHLGLPTLAASLRAPPEPPGGHGADQAREWSYEPCFDDLPIGDPSA